VAEDQKIQDIVDRGGSYRKTTVEEVSAAGPEPTKSYRLRPGVGRHHQLGANGQSSVITAGTVVRLTRAQAHNFKDKFESVDDSDFGVQSGEELRKAAAEPPVSAGVPVVPVNSKSVDGRGPDAPPADVTTLDPARQGQQTREQEAAKLSGAGPVPDLGPKGPEPSITPAATAGGPGTSTPVPGSDKK